MLKIYCAQCCCADVNIREIQYVTYSAQYYCAQFVNVQHLCAQIFIPIDKYSEGHNFIVHR